MLPSLVFHVLRIQRAWRTRVAYKVRIEVESAAASIIGRAWKRYWSTRFLVIVHQAKVRCAAVAIQKVVRGKAARKRYTTMRFLLKQVSQHRASEAAVGTVIIHLLQPFSTPSNLMRCG